MTRIWDRIRDWAEGRLDVWTPPEAALRGLSHPPHPRPIPYVEYDRATAEHPAELAGTGFERCHVGGQAEDAAHVADRRPGAIADDRGGQPGAQSRRRSLLLQHLHAALGREPTQLGAVAREQIEEDAFFDGGQDGGGHEGRQRRAGIAEGGSYIR